MLLTTDDLRLYKENKVDWDKVTEPTPVYNYFYVQAGVPIASLIHMVNMCPDFYTVTYQRERIVRVEHTGGEFLAFIEPYVFGRDEDNEPEWHTIDDPTEFASFCNTIVVERAIGGEVIPVQVGIEEWIKFGSVE